MKASLILCDWAESINGKLYIQGAGWSQSLANAPSAMAVAVLIKVPWDRANHKLPIELVLRNEDSEIVRFNDEEIVVRGDIEAGRPPGLKAGVDLDISLAMKFNGILFPPGGYVFEFSIDGEVLDRASFQAIGA